jgi:hypothetical protein
MNYFKIVSKNEIFDIKAHTFAKHFNMSECTKTHLQQCTISKYSRGRNPRTPTPQRRPRLTRPGRERLTWRGDGRGRGKGREENEGERGWEGGEESMGGEEGEEG